MPIIALSTYNPHRRDSRLETSQSHDLEARNLSGPDPESAGPANPTPAPMDSQDAAEASRSTARPSKAPRMASPRVSPLSTPTEEKQDGLTARAGIAQPSDTTPKEQRAEQPPASVKERAPGSIDASTSCLRPRRTSHDPDQDHEEAEAGPSRSPSRSGSMSIPPPRRHRSGILMTRVRTRSGAGGLLAGGGSLAMSTSKSSGDLVAFAESGGALSGSSPEENDVLIDDPGHYVSRSSVGGAQSKRIFSEGDRRASGGDDDAMWDNSARFYQHMHSRPPSRAGSRHGSPDGSPRSGHRIDPASVSPTTPLYLRRSLPLPHNGSWTSAAGADPSGSGGTQAAGLSPNQQFLHSHLPPAFPFPSGGGSHPSSGLATSEPGAGGAGLLQPTPVHHPMVILTPTTAEWKELQKEMEDEDVGSEAGMSSASSLGGESASGSPTRDRSGEQVERDERRSSADSALGLQLTQRLSRPPSFAASASNESPRRPSLRSAVSADFLESETTHTPDPGSPAPPEPSAEDSGIDAPARPVFHSIITAASPDPAHESNQQPLGAQLDHGRDIPSGITLPPAEPGVHEPQSPSQAFGFGVALPKSSQLPTISVDSTPETSPDADEQPARFATIGRRESLRAVVKDHDGSRPALVKKKTKRELEREKLFRDLDEELQAEQKRPTLGEASSGWSSVQQIGAGLGLDSRPASAGSTASATSIVAPASARSASDVKTTSPTSPARSSTFPQSSGSKTAAVKNLSTSPTQPLKRSPLHGSPLMARNGLPGITPQESPSTDDGEPPLDEAAVASTSSSRRPSQTAKTLESIRDYAKTLMSPHGQVRDLGESSTAPATEPHSRKPTGRRRITGRVSLVAGRVIQPFTVPANTSLPPAKTEPSPPGQKRSSLQSFSPFKASTLHITPPPFSRLDSSLSSTSSIGVPDLGTPSSENGAGGMGGGGIDDYAILSEAGKGAYGLVVRAKVKGPSGEPVGVSSVSRDLFLHTAILIKKDEVIIKYIIKTRILADCWKKHKVLGPIPVEIHVMDQIRHLIYHSPPKPHPWDPSRPRSDTARNDDMEGGTGQLEPSTDTVSAGASPSRNSGTGSPGSNGSMPLSSPALLSPTQKLIHSEIKVSPERGHPNICKLLDFFEDREFYYMVMPRFGTGLDLFDYVEASPNGLSPFEVRSLMGQLADAVRFLHANGIVHRDIKDENVILDGSGRCQLIDFGSAAHWRPGKRWDTFSGTLHYASPEILRGEMYGGKEQDVYALGTVMYVLLVGETPFSQLPDEVLVGLQANTSADEALVARCGTGDGSSDGLEADGGGRLGDAMDLVRRCLEPEVGDRPTAEQMCSHRFLRGSDGGWVGPKGWVKTKLASSLGRSSPRPIMVGPSPSSPLLGGLQS